MFVVFPPHTDGGKVIFGKNADRPSSEVQEVISLPAKDHPPGESLQCTYLEIEQASHTYAIILSKPAWCWGAEMGANENGVCIGREATWTRVNSPDDLKEKLLGADLVRLGLERAKSAREGVDVITTLLSNYGQGGRCSEDLGLSSWAHHSSFLIVDGTEGWVLETAGTHWAAEKITDGARHIANGLTIHTRMDLKSEALVDTAKSLSSYTEEDGKFDFAKSFSVEGMAQSETSAQSGIPIQGRHEEGQKALERFIGQGKFGFKEMCEVVREGEGIISMSGAFISTASQISVLSPPDSPSPACHWFTATPNPRISFFKPFVFTPGATIGSDTIAPKFGDDDPLKTTPRFQKEVDRRHPLYRLHEKFCALLDRADPKGHFILETVKELDEKCFDDVEEVLKNFDEKSALKMSQIFGHMVSLEMNFYK